MPPPTPFPMHPSPTSSAVSSPRTMTPMAVRCAWTGGSAAQRSPPPTPTIMLGHLTGIEDAAGNQWSYSYDSLGRKTAASDPDLGRWTYQYDNADRLTQVTDALGQATAYTYDAASRTLTKTARYGTAQAATTSYTYDDADW